MYFETHFSFFANGSLPKPVLRHLTDSVQMNKRCSQNKQLDDLMALKINVFA